MTTTLNLALPQHPCIPGLGLPGSGSQFLDTTDHAVSLKDAKFFQLQ